MNAVGKPKRSKETLLLALAQLSQIALRGAEDRERVVHHIHQELKLPSLGPSREPGLEHLDLVSAGPMGAARTSDEHSAVLEAIEGFAQGVYRITPLGRLYGDDEYLFAVSRNPDGAGPSSPTYLRRADSKSAGSIDGWPRRLPGSAPSTR